MKNEGNYKKQFFNYGAECLVVLQYTNYTNMCFKDREIRGGKPGGHEGLASVIQTHLGAITRWPRERV